jgi:hypothetical protein
MRDLTSGPPNVDSGQFTQGLADQNRAREIQMVASSLGAQTVDCEADILEGARIASTRLVRTPIADAPNRYSLTCQLVSNMSQLFTCGKPNGASNRTGHNGSGEEVPRARYETP